MNGTIAIATIQAAKQWSLNRGGGVVARRSASDEFRRKRKLIKRHPGDPTPWLPPARSRRRGLAFGRSQRRQPETQNAWVRGANGRGVSQGRFRVVGCGAFRLGFDGALGGEIENMSA